MELNPVASWVLVIGYIVCAVTTTVLLGGLVYALSKLTAKLEELLAKAEPLLAKADEALTVTNEKITAIGDKAEGILAQGEETAESVHHKVDRTATAVQRTIHAPIIGLNSLAAGVSRGVQTFSRLQREVAPTDGAPEIASRGTTNNQEEQIRSDRDLREALTLPVGKEMSSDGG